jgi:hypothetical protein
VTLRREEATVEHLDVEPSGADDQTKT